MQFNESVSKYYSHFLGLVVDSMSQVPWLEGLLFCCFFVIPGHRSGLVDKNGNLLRLADAKLALLESRMEADRQWAFYGTSGVLRGIAKWWVALPL